MKKQIQKLSFAVEQSANSVIITDIKGNIEYVNKKFIDISGYTYEEVLGKNPRILKTNFRSKEEYKELWNTILSGKDWKGVFCNRNKKGEIYWESAVISPIKNKKGELINFLAIKEDITLTKKLEAELIQNQKMLSTLMSNLQSRNLQVRTCIRLCLIAVYLPDFGVCLPVSLRYRDS